jgi:hypothetical protein
METSELRTFSRNVNLEVMVFYDLIVFLHRGLVPLYSYHHTHNHITQQ